MRCVKLNILTIIAITIWYKTTPIVADLYSECILKETCSSCLQTLGCAWCAEPVDPKGKTEFNLTRCISSEHRSTNWCSEKQIVNPEIFKDIMEDNELRTSSKESDAVQIKPQWLKLKMRKGTEVKISIEYQQAEDYPIDLYFLMDLSNSMKDDKEKLSALGNRLVSEMRLLSNNFRVGFGSFVDKPEMPYVNTKPSRLKPCADCEPAYSFKNKMPLTSDGNKFASEVRKASISSNMDFPEGGFDGLMQAMVCTDEVGWRTKARKIILFTTDANFHVAGDGKLAGIVEPNDEQCHLDNNGTYTHALIKDYPSIGQLNKIAKQNNINIIFAAVKAQEKTYKKLKTQIEGASYGILTKDSSNIVDLVKQEYQALVNSITLTDNANGAVEIQYFTDCGKDEEKNTNKCEGLKGRPKIKFTAVLKVLDCPEDQDQWKKIIEIKPSSLNESLKIELELLCKCPCEQNGHLGFELNSGKCNHNGNLQCGICDCASGRYGKYCECDSDEIKSIPEDTSNCKPDANATIECSGKGFCKCGRCDCFKRASKDEVISGTFCECDNYSCKRQGGLLCSGPERGRCECGKCICQSGWSGPACGCKVDNTTCIAPETDKVCSNHGSCVCGACQCDFADNFRYSGPYCEECPTCSSQRCNEFRHCVECQVHGTGLYNKDECKLKCTAFQTEQVDKVEIFPDNTNEKLCKIPDDGGCTIIFKYRYESDEDSKVTVQGQKTKECTSKQIDLIAIIAGVIGGTVLAGLVMLAVWKIFTTIHDQREYTKFEMERKMAKFDRGDNPLYKPSTSTFNNPTFNNIPS